MQEINRMMRFIMANNAARIFPRWPLTQIFDFLIHNSTRGNVYIAEENGEIIGLMFVGISPEQKIFYIKQLIIKNKKALEYFINLFKRDFSSYTICSQRRGTTKVHRNLTRIFKHLLKES